MTLMHANLARVLFGVGCRLRGSPVMRYVEELEESQWWSEADLREMQLRKLRSLLVHAREHSPFYRRHFESNGFDCGIDSLVDFKKLPSVGKNEIAARHREIQNPGPGGRLVFSKTAGTTSIPLRFYRSQDWDAQHRAAIARGLRWYGVDMWTPNAMLWAIPPGTIERVKVRIGDFLLNRFRQRSLDLDGETLEAFYRALGGGVRYLSGYSSMLYEFARHVNERHRGERRQSLALVKGTSEKILPHYQGAAREAFGTKITGEYGSAEAGIIAFECPEGSYHVNMDHVIIEVEDDEIVVTNLVSHSFPFIRYRLGDYIRLAEGTPCPCGRKGLVIEDIMGRSGLRVYGKAGKVFPSIAMDQIIKRLVALGDAVAQCQAVQHVEGETEFRVVLAGRLGSSDRWRVRHFFEEMMPRYFGTAIDYRVAFVNAIPRGRNKFLEFVSEIRRTS
jgi:phenylacetate-CoA ligase